MLSYGLGFMTNTGRNSAFGALAFGDVEGEGRAGMAMRYRRWLGPRTSLDLTGGVHLLGDASSGNVRPGSPTIRAKLQYGELVGIQARVDVLNVRNGCINTPFCPNNESGRETRVYGGVELGSWTGLAGYAATGVLIVIALLALRDSGYY